MARTQYERGRDVEYAAQDKLRAAGWFAQRAPSSKGPADIVACRRFGEMNAPGPIVLCPEQFGLATVAFVNCKRTITDCGPADWNKTWNAAVAVGAIPLMAGRWRGIRGVRFMRMLGPKRVGGHNVAQPWEPFEIGGCDEE